MKKHLIRNFRVAKIFVHKETVLNLKDHLWSFLGSFIGIASIGLISSKFLTASDTVFLIGSFGASSVLIYGAIESPLAQPRNLVGGHILSAIVGVTVQKIVPDELWLSAALSVSLAIIIMQITKTLHPPGGATALIANMGSEKIKSLGFLYVFSPVLTGVVILLLVALIVNNLSSKRNYPSKKSRLKILNFPMIAKQRKVFNSTNSIKEEKLMKP